MKDLDLMSATKISYKLIVLSSTRVILRNTRASGGWHLKELMLLGNLGVLILKLSQLLTHFNL